MTYVLFAGIGVIMLGFAMWALVAGARRVLGVRVGTLRALVAAIVAGMAAGLIGRALPQPGPGQEETILLFVIPFFGGTLACAMAIVFVLEVIKPSGSGLFTGLRSIRGRLARARRYSVITRIAVKHGLGGYLAGRRIRGSNRALARSFRMALEDGGVTFVKLGQVLSTRPDLLPPEFIEELSRLQDRVAPVPTEQVRAVLDKELPGDVLTSFDPQPLASASVAQVHRARLRDGSDIVVKVQRPDIRPTVERDLDILRRIAATLEARTSWARSLGVIALAEGFTDAVLEELDFRVEARNLGAVAAASTGGPVRLPRVYPELSTERVLVLERLDGVPLGSATVDDASRFELARGLLHCLLRQVIDHGVFHADPHPGNVLLLADGRLGLLDFGSVGRLDATLRDGLRNLLLAIDRGDAAGLRDGLLEVVERPDEIDEQRLERALGAFMAKHLGAGSAPDLDMFTDLFRLVSAFGLAIPPAIAAVFRALATMEGTLGRLSPGFNIVHESRSFAASRFGIEPSSLRQTATQELTAMLPVLRRIPRRIDRITGALEEGRLSVNIRLLADERERRMVTGMLHQVLLAFIGATAGIMAVLLLGTSGGPLLLGDMTLYQAFGYNLLLISTMLGLRLLFTVFRAQRTS
jgi:ubiquinone biosynthesis protein